MNGLIVEKVELDLCGGGRKREFFALATSYPIKESVCYSLAFEAYLTPWTEDRAEAETIQRQRANA